MERLTIQLDQRLADRLEALALLRCERPFPPQACACGEPLCARPCHGRLAEEALALGLDLLLKEALVSTPSV